MRARITVYGLVQGVGYRWFAYKKATAYHLTGFVKNTDDGNVYCEAEGEKAIVEQFIAELKKGPTFSRVKEIQTAWLDTISQFDNFQIRE